MVKRASNQAPGQSPKSPRASKRVRADPVLVSIAGVIKQSEHLPAQVRAMLVDMLPFSLGVPSDERHEFQTRIVNAVEQALNTKRSELEAAAASVSADLDKLKSSGVELENRLKEANNSHEAQKETLKNAEVASAEAKEARSAAAKSLSTAQSEQKGQDAKLASAQEEKAALESALKEHFEAPMQEGSGPNFKELKHYLKHLQIDRSLHEALPESCGKSKDDRGSFDEVVVHEFAKAFRAQIAELGVFIVTDTPATVQRAAAVQAAEKDFDVKSSSQKQCSEALEAAKKELSDRTASLTQLQQAVNEFDPQLGALAKLLDDSNHALRTFESGPLSNFMTYKARVTASPEAAPAGA